MRCVRFTPHARLPATKLALLALTHWDRALTLRMRALTAGGWTTAERNRWFTESKAELLVAEQTLGTTWAAFPVWARPDPSLHA
jgi:hypothetical protein